MKKPYLSKSSKAEGANQTKIHLSKNSKRTSHQVSKCSKDEKLSVVKKLELWCWILKTDEKAWIWWETSVFRKFKTDEKTHLSKCPNQSQSNRNREIMFQKPDIKFKILEISAIKMIDLYYNINCSGDITTISIVWVVHSVVEKLESAKKI